MTKQQQFYIGHRVAIAIGGILSYLCYSSITLGSTCHLMIALFSVLSALIVLRYSLKVIGETTDDEIKKISIDCYFKEIVACLLMTTFFLFVLFVFYAIGYWWLAHFGIVA
jgi:hypothetical protein